MVVSPSWLPFFLNATVGPRSHLKMGPAAGRRTKARPKRLSGLFYLPGIILGCSMGQIRRMGDGTTINKTTVLNRFGVFVASFCRPCAESGPSSGPK